MKRILLSGAIATGLHAVFLISLPMLSQKNYKHAIPETKSVIVTMSYQTLIPKKEKQKVKPVKKFVRKKMKSAPQQKPEIKPVPQANPNPLEKIQTKQNVTDAQHLDKKTPVFQSKESLKKNKGLITITEPFYKKKPLLKYPLKAKRRGYEGTVELMVQVSKEGIVSNLWIFKSSNYKSLDNQAVKIVKNWIFEPGKKNGRPEEMWVKIPVKFRLN
ncbi:MAG: energy transducer TonB [Desulfobacteraceae bacterium]|nr:energy transducer TonB [Desulfobacteraceae bacterium]